LRVCTDIAHGRASREAVSAAAELLAGSAPNNGQHLSCLRLLSAAAAGDSTTLTALPQITGLFFDPLHTGTFNLSLSAADAIHVQYSQNNEGLNTSASFVTSMEGWTAADSS